VHLVCQEPHPEKFDYVARAIRYDEKLSPTSMLDREVPYPGRCVMHKPKLGEVLPVYVWDKYEEYDKVVPMVELGDDVIDDYLERNVALLDRLVGEHGITAIHANHAVLMSVVAQRVAEKHRIPFTIMPHGSAIEYAVKKDERFHRFASEAFDRAGRLFVIGPEIRSRVNNVFTNIKDVDEKMVDLNLGVDTSLFEPIDPGDRPANIRKLGEALQGIERGKDPQLTRGMRHKLSDGMGRDLLRKVLAGASDYTAKHTDTDCEDKLAAVDWEREKILLFVGRLIASKGIHGIIAALPSILKEVPGTRLIVVGHGPLREPLEAMLWALDTGNRELFRNIVRWGRTLEGAKEPEPLEHIEHYLDQLEKSGELDAYFETARRLHISERVVFTGYLTHRELRFLFPCCDVAIFPSIVAEAGPLVFLEAMASGVFPMGIYFAGMAASIDSVSEIVPQEVVELMKLRKDPEHTVADIVEDTLGALALGRKHAADLRKVAVDRYDWKAVGKKLLTTLEGLSD
jgi:glycosyltransferase involved in cell wall biosynthesis